MLCVSAASVVVLPTQYQGLFIVNGQLCTKNMFPGEAVYDDTFFAVQNEDGTEVDYRVWDPSRSTLAALILRGLDYFSIKPGVKVLYLGADSLATVSHLSDIVGTSGMVYSVTSSPFSDMAINRANAQIMALNASHFLKIGGHFIVCIRPNCLKYGMPIPSGAVLCVQFMKLLGEGFEPYQEVDLERRITYYVGAYKGRAQVDSHTIVQRK